MRLAATAILVGLGLLGTVGATAEDRGLGLVDPLRFVDARALGPTVAERLAVIQERIQHAIVYPPTARMQQVEGEALVRFDINHDGEPQRVAVHRSSGAPTLDRAAQRAVTHAAPFPWVYGRLEVPVRFALNEHR
jgi:TonB family protein